MEPRRALPSAAWRHIRRQSASPRKLAQSDHGSRGIEPAVDARLTDLARIFDRDENRRRDGRAAAAHRPGEVDPDPLRPQRHGRGCHGIAAGPDGRPLLRRAEHAEGALDRHLDGAAGRDLGGRFGSQACRQCDALRSPAAETGRQAADEVAWPGGGRRRGRRRCSGCGGSAGSGWSRCLLRTVVAGRGGRVRSAAAVRRAGSARARRSGARRRAAGARAGS